MAYLEKYFCDLVKTANIIDLNAVKLSQIKKVQVHLKVFENDF